MRSASLKQNGSAMFKFESKGKSETFKLASEIQNNVATAELGQLPSLVGRGPPNTNNIAVF